jgi:hypothetical protein
MITDTLNFSITGTDGERVTGSDVEAGNARVGLDQTIPAGSTNLSVSMAWTVANTESIFIVASQNCTIKTNSSGSPANTINLVANIPLVWGKSAGYFSNPFTVDVTSWFVTCSAATRLQAAILTS